MQALREAIAQKTERLYGYQPDADSDITVTAGGDGSVICSDYRIGAQW
ncbi:hypothetical protein MJ581_03430 [Escherichia coli]|nr:hypothetical protein MJ581_03430 [Escherichia coli]